MSYIFINDKRGGQGKSEGDMGRSEAEGDGRVEGEEG